MLYIAAIRLGLIRGPWDGVSNCWQVLPRAWAIVLLVLGAWAVVGLLAWLVVTAVRWIAA